MDWAAAAQGLRTSRAEDTRKRQEMAKAFAEFKAANPYASAAEFQDFIDRYSGGRNYIAGGAPSASILRAIGMENQKRKAQDEFRQRMSDIQTRQQTIQSLQALADQALLGMKGDDFASVRDEVIGQFGPDGASLLGDFNVNSMFTPTRRQQLVAERMRTLLPGALELARTTGGVLKSSDIAAMYPGIEPAILDPLVAEANRVREKEIAEEKKKVALERANAESTISTTLSSNANFQAALRSGDMKKAREIAAREVNRYNSVFTDAPLGDDFITGIIDENLEGQQALQLSEHQKLYQDAQTRQQDAVTKLEEEALASVNRAFRASENGTPSVLTGEAGPNGLLAAQYLARAFDTSSPAALDALAGLFALETSKGKTVEQLITEGTAALTAAGVPNMAFAKQQAVMARGVNIPEMKSFPAWRSETEADIRADFSAMDAEVRRIGSITDPEQAKIEIARITGQIEQLRKLHLGAMQDARVNQNIWIPVGEEGWNDGQVFGQQGSVVAMMDAEITKLNEKLNLLSSQALQKAQQEAPAPGEPKPVIQQPAPAAPQTGAQRFVSGIGDDLEATRLLRRGADAIATGNTALPGSSPISRLYDWFTEPTADPQAFGNQQAEAERLMNFLREPEAKQYLRDNPQTLELLQSDPVAWARQAYAALEKSRAAQ